MSLALGASLWATSFLVGASLGMIGKLPPWASFVLNLGPVFLGTLALALLFYGGIAGGVVLAYLWIGPLRTLSPIPRVIDVTLDGLMQLEPTLTQFLIYGPTPGTPFYEQVMSEGRLHQDLAADRETYYRNCLEGGQMESCRNGAGIRHHGHLRPR